MNTIDLKSALLRSAMKDCRAFYIDGSWVEPSPGSNDLVVNNPADETPIATVSLGTPPDISRAVAAARKAFASYGESSLVERKALLNNILRIYQSRKEEMAEAISREMGAPIRLSRTAQVPAGAAHFSEILKVLEGFRSEELKGSTLMRKEPIGVCGLITPWNWPMNQICCKVAPALAAGCTMVLKPSEFAPLSARLYAEILDEAGVPKGVFNLVNGVGNIVGSSMATHPDVDMVSFTGSTKAGVSVAVHAAPTIKRVTQELGGKSANIILEDADLDKAVADGVLSCFRNTGQSCNAPTRMLIPRKHLSQVIEIAKKTAESVVVGEPMSEDTLMGPLANKAQFEKVQHYIRRGLEEGATLVAGGLGRPNGIVRGYFVKPTIFGQVNNEMDIAREEIFGPVLCLISYEDEEEAIRLANDTPYGLSAFVSSRSQDHARQIAARIRAGNVHLNNARPDFGGSFGGYKQSGNGREWGESGFEEFFELKSVFGYAAPNVA